jgi:hypothetical protein
MARRARQLLKKGIRPTIVNKRSKLTPPWLGGLPCHLHLSETALRRGCASGGWFSLEYPFKPYGDRGADYRACDVDSRRR